MINKLKVLGEGDVFQYCIDLMQIEIDALNQMKKEEPDEEKQQEIEY